MDCHPEKLLVVRRGALGDLILTLPFLRVLKQLHPRADLEVLGPFHLWSVIAGGSGWVRRIHDLEAFNLSALYVCGGQIPPAVREFFAAFDGIYYIGTDPEGVIRSQLSRHGLSDVKFISPFPPPGGSVRVSDHLIDQLGDHGFSPATLRPVIFPGEASLLLGGRVLKDLELPVGHPLLAIHPGSGSPGKNWPRDHFGEIIRRCLQRKRATPLVFLGEAEAGEMTSWARHLSAGKFPLLCDLPLSLLASVLACCHLYLGNDSGVTHLAAALRVPTIALFGSTDPAVWGPRGERVVILSPPTPSGMGSGSAGLEVETVWRKVEEMLRGIVTGQVPGTGSD
ncbi:MAG: glycosyltransferase family 9 protein [Candidatus Tectomicrobia bacterium]|uniref:Glycosyltransferase family 9 protein n=1 Tax=Tectimicrobiota bacterium TaxID=2528274 RepID=A0A932GMI1_UNCTE|nr:glycosyltransferase family 9 protein [Candidatus Tectomicrobia bacterium]